LSKHQCNEQNLRILKKKKEIKKKRWRDIHWKRRMDLSHIETMSLNNITKNIADNLNFCIDGTYEDLNAFSREVKDYLNTDLGSETQVQMFLRCCFGDVYKKLGSAPSALLNIDVNLISKANSYFVDSIYVPTKNFDQKNSKLYGSSTFSSSSSTTPSTSRSLTFNCRNCRAKFNTMSELIHHQREIHKLNFKTTFDYFNNNNNNYDYYDENEPLMYCSNAPVGYFECDPFSFLFNLHWDQTLQVRCQKCNEIFPRNKVSKHFLTCINKKIEYDEFEFDCSELINDLIRSIEMNQEFDQNNNESKMDQDIIINEQISDQSNDSIFTNPKENYNFNLRRFHSCDKCGLEFTSANSVMRHKEKSCLRVKVNDKNCPICSATFSNTHRLSIHIYKHHRTYLGSASLPPVAM